MRPCLTLLLLPIAAAAHAEERRAADDRGRRGFFVGAGGGVSLGSAADDNGADFGSFTGSGGWLRVGEEVLPGFTLGLAFSGSGANANNDAYGVGGGGFVLEGSWRPWGGLVLLAGAGFGGAELTAEAPAEGAAQVEPGTGAGAFFELGFTWEFDLGGAEDEGFALGPAFYWYLVPDTPDAPVSMSAFVIGVGTTWYAGR